MRLMPCPPPPRLLTIRMAVIVAIAPVVGAAAGALTYLTFHSLPQALLAAGTATGGSTGLLDQIIATEPKRKPNHQENNQHDDHGVGLPET